VEFCLAWSQRQLRLSLSSSSVAVRLQDGGALTATDEDGASSTAVLLGLGTFAKERLWALEMLAFLQPLQ
jgi:hypothetical protein